MVTIFSDILTFAAGGVFGVLVTAGVFLFVDLARNEAAKWSLWELEASLGYFTKQRRK
jgi:hypothetical protein